MFDSISVLSLTSLTKSSFNKNNSVSLERMTSVSRLFFVILLILCFTGCEKLQNGETGSIIHESDVINYHALTPFVDSTMTSIQVVIEIPAGSNEKIEINKESQVFESERWIEYLPYPVNYGFVPGTLSDKEKGGDGDPLDLLLLSKRVPTGSVLSGFPIATLKLIDNGEEDAKLLVLPADPDLRILPCDTWECITTNYPHLPKLLEDWFLGYKGAGMMISQGWADAEESREIINRHIP
jgi:inorganic pyrophosphatase